MTSEHRQRDTSGTGGFGLIEVMVAIVVSSLGVIAVAGVGLGVSSQAKLAGWDTDQGLVARSQFEAIAKSGYASALPGQVAVALGPRTYAVTRTVATPTPRLKSVRVSVSSVTGRAPATFETRVARARPLPVAP